MSKLLVRKEGNTHYYNENNLKVGHSPPTHYTSIGVLGIQQGKRSLDLGYVLRDLINRVHTPEMGHSPEILVKMIQKNDVAAIQEWLKRFPAVYDPGLFLMMYLLERRETDKILATAITTGFHYDGEPPLAYNGFFLEGEHLVGFFKPKEGAQDVDAYGKMIERLKLELKARFGDALDNTKIEIPVRSYSGGKLITDAVITIRPRSGIETLFT